MEMPIFGQMTNGQAKKFEPQLQACCKAKTLMRLKQSIGGGNPPGGSNAKTC
jgi:hypothetical protein